ncbi:hypothetical protein ZWY2020_049998 [Hordeum vulgare]|nr:hypothetical protein ZWY2020_049998 [Hordeum vulgare]
MEVEAARCECCGFTEECTPEYIAAVRAEYLGRWVCGLCAAAVGVEVRRAGAGGSARSPRPRRSIGTARSREALRAPGRRRPRSSWPPCRACSGDASISPPASPASRRRARSPRGRGARSTPRTPD